jgi:hypothetical protein
MTAQRVDENFSGRVLGSAQARFLLRLAERIVPESASSPASVRQRLAAIVDHQLDQQPPGQQFQFKLLLFALRWMTVPVTLHTLENLPPRWQDYILRRLEAAPLTILRVGIWGVKTLVFMGYYGQPLVTAGISYEPSKNDGNGMLHRSRNSNAGQP